MHFKTSPNLDLSPSQQAYLFKAALTELRNDTAMRIRNETAGINTSMAACRKELDNVSARMKEQLDILRHE
jgi:hypothetical protein